MAKPGFKYPRLRVAVLLGMVFLGATALLARSIDLQVINRSFYQGQGDARHLRDVGVPAVRGRIFDRNGDPLAISTPVESVWAIPRDLLAEPGQVEVLAEALQMDAEPLAQRLAQRSAQDFVWLRRHVNPDVAVAIEQLDLPGVHLSREYRRFYPAGEAVSHVLGFTDIDDRGQEGLELAFDEWLTGQSGVKRVLRDRRGRVIEQVELVKPAQSGRDLTLSIDRRLQYVAYRELKGAVVEHKARSATCVILEATTGEILALVNLPSFNPNSRQRDAGDGVRNRALTDFFEPGSVIKPFAIMAALESGRFDEKTLLDTAPGTMKIGQYTIRDTSNHGLMDVRSILVESSNVGMSKLALSLKAEHMYDVLTRFGFGEVTGSGFPGESPGIVPGYDRWREVEQATISYGYGLTVTPLQLAQAFAAIADGGRMRPPTFVHGTQSPGVAVIDPTLSRRMVDLLEGVVVEGTGGQAKVANYRVAGKTGTSRKAGQSGYDERYIGTFAGIAPASDPKLVGVVVINDPQLEAYYGGDVAAPVFARVMAAALRLLNVPADGVET